MNIIKSLIHLVIILGITLLIGCSSSEETSTTTDSAGQAVGNPVTPPKEIMDSSTKNVTPEPKKIPESSQDVPKTELTIPYGKFAVQVGAYSMLDNAEPIASSAKNRFGKNVYTIHDKVSNLFKVMVGDFTTKDEARLFRDRMVQQYPGEYNDAWVAEFVR